jgi:hypothetical protein
VWKVLAHLLGLDDASGPWYLWWSGVAGNLSLIGAPYILWRHHNCEAHRCPRIGRHRTAAGHRVCRKHHPESHLKPHHITAAHHDTKNGTRP